MKELLTDDGQYKEVHLTLRVNADGIVILDDSLHNKITSTDLASVQRDDCDEFLEEIRQAIEKRIGLL